MCNAWINAASILNFKLNIACPVGYAPKSTLISEKNNLIRIMHDPNLAVKNADLVTTDVFASMGQENQQQARLKDFSGFLVDHALMKSAKSDALFMHCLPAHRGEEVSEELLEDQTISVVWDEAENRLHAQKALMAFLLNPT